MPHIIVNTVTAAIIVAFLGWVAIEVNAMGKRIVSIQTTLSSIQELQPVVKKLNEKILILEQKLKYLEGLRQPVRYE